MRLDRVSFACTVFAGFCCAMLCISEVSSVAQHPPVPNPQPRPGQLCIANGSTACTGLSGAACTRQGSVFSCGGICSNCATGSTPAMTCVPWKSTPPPTCQGTGQAGLRCTGLGRRGVCRGVGGACSCINMGVVGTCNGVHFPC